MYKLSDKPNSCGCKQTNQEVYNEDLLFAKRWEGIQRQITEYFCTKRIWLLDSVKLVFKFRLSNLLALRHGYINYLLDPQFLPQQNRMGKSRVLELHSAWGLHMIGLVVMVACMHGSVSILYIGRCICMCSNIALF